GRIKGKGSLRSIGRVLEIPTDDIDVLSDAMPLDAQEFTISLGQIDRGEKEASPKAIHTIREYKNRSKKNTDYINACVGLEGTYRSSGIHAAGVVIG
ncbi:hypothetical protein, partial [Salmonella enterica]|uniref:hypothetical protein n=1 Tax=Salmonella enterica TaxID=28901 RepID=UPI000EBC38FB